MDDTSGRKLVVLDYSQLLEPSYDISDEIESAFGPAGLGIIAISNVPQYVEARADLLPLAETLEQLPAAAKQALEDPESSFSFGWSFGRESLQGGRKDTLKGSFYANPIHDVPTNDFDQIRMYPAYCRPNLWPHTDLPTLEPAFKRLGRIIVDVGSALADHCDEYVTNKVKQLGSEYSGGMLSCALKRSRAHKARLLYYKPGPGDMEDREPDNVDSRPCDDACSRPLWCNWHLDHGSLTGLTRAQYCSNGAVCPSPDENCGLYIRKQDGTELQVHIPENCIAFQMGQAMSIQSGGLFCATPHCVQAARGHRAEEVSRSTFAVFMQPMWDEILAPPPGVHPTQKTLESWGPWKPGMNFGEFSEHTLGSYYDGSTE